LRGIVRAEARAPNGRSRNIIAGRVRAAGLIDSQREHCRSEASQPTPAPFLRDKAGRLGTNAPDLFARVGSGMGRANAFYRVVQFVHKPPRDRSVFGKHSFDIRFGRIHREQTRLLFR